MLIRRPAVAGRFYPGDAPALRREVDRHLGAACVEPAPDAIVAMMVPHAGYPYSGLTAAHAFQRVRGKTARRVVLLGCSHQYRFEGLSLVDEGALETPLGRVPVDEELAGRLAAEFGSSCPEAHDGEHALEVQLPFLQVVLAAGFHVVPVLFGTGPSDFCEGVGRTLAEWLHRDDLVLASTDLSHFLPERAANRIDRRSLETVLSRDGARLRAGTRDESCSLCGATAVVAAMAYANSLGARRWELLDYRTSAWGSGDTSRVVGYGAITMAREAA